MKYKLFCPFHASDFNVKLTCKIRKQVFASNIGFGNINQPSSLNISSFY